MVAALRSATARSTAPNALRQDVLKLCDDVDLVADEFRAALDYDPDATRLLRAARAEKSTSAEINSILMHALTRDPVNNYGMHWLGVHYQEANPQFEVNGPCAISRSCRCGRRRGLECAGS